MERSDGPVHLPGMTLTGFVCPACGSGADTECLEGELSGGSLVALLLCCPTCGGVWREGL